MLAHLSIFVDIQPSEKKLGPHRAEAESVRLLYSLSTEFTKYASRIYDCSQILKFAPTLTSWYLNTLILSCPLLSSVPVAKVFIMAGGHVSAVTSNQEKVSSYRWVFLTLTVKNPLLLN